MSVEDEKAYWLDRTSLQDMWSEPGDGVEQCLAQILPAIKRSRARRILDLGCGIGRLTLPVAEAFPHAFVFGVDVNVRALEVASGRAEAHPMMCFVQGDGRRIPEIGWVDAVFSVLLFQHLEAPTVVQYIRDVMNSLTDDGIFCFQYVENEDEGGFMSHTFRRETVAQWCRDVGFEIVEIESAVFPHWVWVTARRPSRPALNKRKYHIGGSA